jgi:RHS repeat-associated protein
LWALADNQGTVRDVVDSTGTVVNHITYDSFGGITSQSNPTASMRFGYTGRELDTETGLYYYRARYYDAAVGEFISEDPIGFEAGDANLYRYVGNSPINRIDPSGLLTLYQGNPLIDGLSASNPGMRQVLNLVPGIKSFDLKIQVDAGESFAQSAQQWYVKRYVDANTPSWQKPLYFTGGLFASLWTPCNSDATTAVLTTAWGVAKPAANTTLNDVRGLLQRLKGADDAARGAGSNNRGLSSKQEYWDEYYEAVGTQGDDLGSLINSANNKGINIVPGSQAAFNPNTGDIELAPDSKKWEFFEEFLHSKVAKGWKAEEKLALTKSLRKVKDFKGKKTVSSPSDSAEEIIVKEWLLKHASLVGVGEPEKILLQNQIRQLRTYGTKNY